MPFKELPLNQTNSNEQTTEIDQLIKGAKNAEFEYVPIEALYAAEINALVDIEIEKIKREAFSFLQDLIREGREIRGNINNLIPLL